MRARTFGYRATSFAQVRRYASSARPDLLNCKKCSLFKFGDPTSEANKALFRDLTWRIQDTSDVADKSQAWAIIGPRAGLLADSALLGRARADPPSSRTWPFIGTARPIEDAIKKVSFNTRLESTSYLATAGEFTDYTARYYGIRAGDEDALTLRSHLRKYIKKDAAGAEDESLVETAKALKLDQLLDIPLVALSNGQTRRARMARALLAQPEVLILEEPFTGLDASSRGLIADLLGSLHAKRSPRIVLVLRPQDQVPHWVDSIIEMSPQIPQQPTFPGDRSSWTSSFAAESAKEAVASLPRKVAVPGSEEVFKLEKGNIGYKDRKVLKDITWTLRAGDRVALTGANGSGKSTLLSLILGDHPSSYSQALTLFGKPRTEHSVYSLSTRTGHYSPELFAAFPRRFGDAGLSIYETIGTGFENIFSYRKMSSEQKKQIDDLLTKFDPSKDIFTDSFLHKTLFAEADPPLQALTLILRAAVKTPDLLILDEPFAGMNTELVQRCRTFLDEKLKEHQTMIFISHYEEEWPSSLGKRLHLDDGRAHVTLL